MKKLILILFIILPFVVWPDEMEGIKVLISATGAAKDRFLFPGRLVIYFSRQGQPDPVFQSSFSSGRTGFALNLKERANYKPFQAKLSEFFCSGENPFKQNQEGNWFVQAVYNISGKTRLTEQGNLFSKPVSVTVIGKQQIVLELSDTLKGRGNRNPVSTSLVRYVELESKLLSEFRKKPVKIRASVLLPAGYQTGGAQKYPVRVSIGGYGSSWTRSTRLEQDKRFMDWWSSPDAPAILSIFPDGDGPLGDPYYVDSENNGPYGKALTEELIPYIEKEFHGLGNPAYRFFDGCSTGGWVSFALQVFYPGYFNGAWSYSADPVDFHHLQLVNIYEGKNAFYTNPDSLTPSVRSRSGRTRISIRDEVAGENIQSFDNTYATGGGQWGAWNAVYSPRDRNGQPMEIFHPVNGAIDKNVAEHWKKYDLLEIMKGNWSDLGPKLQGKLWIWMGDLDEFYLNDAMHEMDKFLKSTKNPVSDAVVTFDPKAGHCEGYDQRKVLEMMKKRIETISSGN